jgi:hypothetical protein
VAHGGNADDGSGGVFGGGRDSSYAVAYATWACEGDDAVLTVNEDPGAGGGSEDGVASVMHAWQR